MDRLARLWFSIQKSYKEIILDKKENPHDLGFRAFPPNYVDQCDLLLILEQEKRYRVWFWNPERFFRFAIFEDNKWLPATPCSAVVPFRRSARLFY